MAYIAKKWAIFKEVGAALWLTEPTSAKGTDRANPLHTSIFSMDAAKFCRWYQEVESERSGRGAALTETFTKIITSKMEALRVNFYEDAIFMKSHRRDIVLWCDWCDTNQDGDYGMSSVGKARTFLDFYTETKRETFQQRMAKGDKIKISEEESVFNHYRNVIAVLERIAKWQGYQEFAHNLSRFEDIEVLRKQLFEARNEARIGDQDYAKTSRIRSKRISVQEGQRMLSAIWGGQTVAQVKTVVAKARLQLRDLVCYCVQKCWGRRSQDILAAKYAMLQVHTLEAVKPAPCDVIVVSRRGGKHVTNNEEELLTLARAANREECSVGALAVSVEWQDMTGTVPILATMKRDLEFLDTLDPADYTRYQPEWRKMHLIFTEQQGKKEVSYHTHHDSTTRALDAGNVRDKSAVTHLSRFTTGADIIERGAPFQDVNLYQGWGTKEVCSIDYLKAAVKSFPLMLATGWDGIKEYFCWWEGPDSDIPSELKALVLRDLDEVSTLATRVHAKTGQDASAVAVCEVMRLLRKAFIQDAVVHQPKYPQFAAYANHPLFSHPLWLQYAAEEVQRTEWRKWQYEMEQRDPRVAIWIQQELGKRDAMLTRLGDLLTNLVAAHPTLAASVPAGLLPPPPPPPAPAAAVEAAAVGRRPQILEPSDMSLAYKVWVESDRAIVESHKAVPWKDLFGAEANTYRVRFHKMKPWLTYLDTLAAQGIDAALTISKMEAIAKKHLMEPTSFVKDAFYHMIHTPGANVNPRLAPAEMRREFEAAGLPIPEEKQKRAYNKKRAAEEDGQPVEKRQKA
jgi:hypothetical protein